MRSLALAGIVVLLSGCSLNYVDTSFTAAPKAEHTAEVEHHEATEPKSEESTEPAGETAAESSPIRTGSAFPSTVQPSGK